MVSDVTENEALRQLAMQGAGHDLQCEPQLAKLGARHGFSSARAPEWAAAVRCGLTICLALGPSMKPACMLPAFELAKASATFLKGAPWQYWHSDAPVIFAVKGLVDRIFEGCIMGNGGSEFGVALYENAGSMGKLVSLHRAGKQREAAQMECIAVTFDPAPPFAQATLEAVIGVPALPIPTRVRGGKMNPPSAEDILVLAAALVGAAGLTSTTRVGIGGINQEGIGITVKVTAPKATG